MKHLFKIYAFIFFFIFVAIVYMYISLENTKTILNKNINKLFISQVQEFAFNIEKSIRHAIDKDIYAHLKNNAQLQDALEQEMSIIATHTYQYVYLLYRDVKGDYRFLADGSENDKGEFGEKLSVDKKIYDKAYQSQQQKIIYQDHYDGLWVSYIKPVVLNGKTEAIIGIDFSTTVPSEINRALIPLHNIFIYIFIAIFIILLLFFYQTFLYFKTKKDAITDPLTQSYNRNYLRDLLKTIDITKYQIIMLDIDYFKKINDNYGHKVGDYVLRDIAALVNKDIRENDLLIRFGGEEFLLFIYKGANEEQSLAYNIAQRIRMSIEAENFSYEDISLHVTVSMGVTSTPSHFKNVSDAIKYADKMLYIAKKEGRNKVVSQEMNEFASKSYTQDTKIRLNEIQDALEDARVFCEYQAIFDVKSSKIKKYEALVRIEKKEDGTTIYPNDFIPYILHTNIYNMLTKRVLEIVFKQISESKTYISVNLNFSDILNNDIFEIIVIELEKEKEFAPWLIIELLEYEIIEMSADFQEKIAKIKSYGVKIAIDDFGTGYANYTVFEAIPVDIIKIDGSLIKNIDNSDLSKKIVTSIVSLTKDLGIETVAEFVHSKEVFDIVQSLHIDDAQGFYLAKPTMLVK